MRTLVQAATGCPVILCTTALIVVVFFWLPVAVGAAAMNSFDADIDLDALGTGGVPVAVAVSLLTAPAWLLGRRLTCLFVRPLHRLFPDEPGSARRTTACDRAA